MHISGRISWRRVLVVTLVVFTILFLLYAWMVMPPLNMPRVRHDN